MHQPPQEPFQTLQNPHLFKLEQRLKKFTLQSIDQILQITLDPQLSALFKSKFPQTFPPHTQLTQKLKKLSVQHTYNEMYIYYQQFPLYLKECRQVLKYKYQKDDILRTHHNRKSIWLLCSGALNKIQENPGFYDKLTASRTEYPQFYRHTIQKDVVRTIHQKNSEAQQTLSSILRNLSVRNPYVGYCQGMNFIVNFLILMQFTEEETFWITTELIENWLPKTYYTNMMGVAVDICIVEHYVRLNYPALKEKLQELNLGLSLFVLEWLVCLFTSTLPFYTAELLLKIQQKKKSIFIEEDRFIARINAVFIDEDLISFCRQLIQNSLLAEKVQSGTKTKRKDLPNKFVPVECNIEWPICYKALKQHKSDMGEIEVWTFKEQGTLKPITDYLTLKAKKSFKPFEDNRADSKKLLIGRIPHICDINSYNKKNHQTQFGLELQDFDLHNRKVLIQSLFAFGNKISLEKQHLDFFKTTTKQNLTLLKEETQKVRAISLDKIGKLEKIQDSQHKFRETQINSGPKLQRGNNVEDHFEGLGKESPKIESKRQIIEGQTEEEKKTRNPFKKLRNKWRERKGRNHE